MENWIENADEEMGNETDSPIFELVHVEVNYREKADVFGSHNRYVLKKDNKNSNVGKQDAPIDTPNEIQECNMIGESNNKMTNSRTEGINCSLETEWNICPICLDQFNEGDVVIVSKHCSHLFHKNCILAWLEKHDACPCCRE